MGSLGLGAGLSAIAAIGTGLRLAPFQPSPPLPAGRILISNFQPGHGWVKGGTGGAGADDTAVFEEGTQSVKLTTPASSVVVHFSRAGLPNYNLTTHFLRYRLRINQWTRLGSLFVGATDNAGVFSQVAVLSGVSNVADDGEWVTVQVAGKDLTSGPTINLANIVSIRLSAQAVTQSVELNIQRLELVPLPAEGVVVLAFDDGWRSTYLNALPVMDAKGFAGIVYPICEMLTPGSQSANYMAVEHLHEMQNQRGWDIGCHAFSLAHHNSANGFLDLSEAEFIAECSQMKRWNRQYAFRSDHFAWPKGLHSQPFRTIAAQHFSSLRTFRTTLAAPDAEIFPFGDTHYLRQLAVTGGASPSAASAVRAAIDAAMAAKKTLILTFHGIEDTGASFDYPVTAFGSIIDHIAMQGYKVRTLSQVFASRGA
jgi:peptidoglycan/xylan/chitin deacetylase (PgdA/CDA1 family)